MLERIKSISSHMPRIKREGWKPVTVTLDPEAATRLRVHAAIREMEMGVLVSEMILNEMDPVTLGEAPKKQSSKLAKLS